MRTVINHFRSCIKGTALIEFALVLPIVLLFLVGTVEMSRFAILHMKLDKAANAMADFVTQGNTVRSAELAVFANTMPQIMKPFSFSGTVIFSSVAYFRTDTPPCSRRTRNCIAWQYKALGADNSRLGNPGSAARLPNNYSVTRGQDVIVTEVYYNYTPLLAVTSSIISSLAPQTLYKTALSKPRRGTLTSLK